MTLVHFDSEMCFLKLINDRENDTQNDSEGLKIVRKFNITVPRNPPSSTASNYSLNSFTFFARLLLARINSAPYKKRIRQTWYLQSVS